MQYIYNIKPCQLQIPASVLGLGFPTNVNILDLITLTALCEKDPIHVSSPILRYFTSLESKYPSQNFVFKAM